MPESAAATPRSDPAPRPSDPAPIASDQDELLAAACAMARERGARWLREVLRAAGADRLSALTDDALRALATT